MKFGRCVESMGAADCLSEGASFPLFLLLGFPPGLWPGSQWGHLADRPLLGDVPFFQKGAKFLNQLWILWGEVCFFGRILFEIEKLSPPTLGRILHSFPALHRK